MEKVNVFAPATVANVGPGYDILGFALNSPGDIVRACRVSGKGVSIKKISGDNGFLPLNPEKNTASIAALSVMERLGVKNEGLELELEKGMPLNSGLGSSGASAVAGAYAALKIFGSDEEKINFVEDCMNAEGAVSGFHADNVGPSLLGGFVLIKGYEPLDVVKLPAPESLVAVVINPNCEVSTRKAREIIPKEIPMKSLVRNSGNVSGIVAGILMNDLKLIGRSVNDCVVEPVRATLIPGFDSVKKSALEAGALGCSISGSGPSVFAFADSEKRGEEIAKAMREAFSRAGLSSKKFVSRVNNEGAKEV